MAKSDSSSTFGDFSKKIKLDPSRQNLKSINPKLSFDQYLTIALKEGNALLALEDKMIRPPSSIPATMENSTVLEDKLGKISKNAYVRARVELLEKMPPLARSVIEKMERGELERDLRYDRFCKAVIILGDQLSGDK